MESPRQTDCSQKSQWLGLRFLIPWLLLATFSLDMVLRFLPPGYFYFRAWDVASLFATAEGPFAPNFHYKSDRAYGDLSNLGNRPRLRQYRREIFTTDEFGYRNPPSGVSGDAPAAILAGDSFAAGSGVSDSDTLSAQLTRLSNRRVYNGAGPPPQWKSTKALIERLHLRGGLVIWEVSERVALPESVRTESRVVGVAPKVVSPIREKYPILQKLDLWEDSFLAYSPLRTILTRGFRKIENGALLPNSSENLVAVGHLRNGDSMLFLPSEVENFYSPRYDSPQYLAEIDALVHCSGNEFLVVLVPDKYGVYRSMLRDERLPPLEGGSHLNRLEGGLNRIGIPVLNLTSALRYQAAEGFQRREYNYMLDDTHWNRIGIQTAATEILRVWTNRQGSICNTSFGRNASPAVQ